MATEQANKTEGQQGKPGKGPEVPRTRSPNFPALSLRKAVEKAEVLYKNAKKFAVPAETALKHFGHNSTVSSNALQTVGALKAYGLIESQGNGPARKIGLTETGFQIAGGHPDRANLLKKAALLPPLFAEIWAMRTADGLPPDEAIRQHLQWELKFNEGAIPTFIASFRDTLAFAGISADDSVVEEKKVKFDKSGGRTLWNDDEPESHGFKVGDIVQWSPNEVDQFPEPRPIKGFHGDTHAFFENDGSGIASISELKIVDTKTPQTTPKPQDKPPPPAEGERVILVEERFTLDEGPVTIRWPGKLSADSVADLEHFLDGMLKRAKRKAGVSGDQKPNTDNPSGK